MERLLAMSELNWEPLTKLCCLDCGWKIKFGGRYPTTRAEADEEMRNHPCTGATDE